MHHLHHLVWAHTFPSEFVLLVFWPTNDRLWSPWWTHILWCVIMLSRYGGKTLWKLASFFNIFFFMFSTILLIVIPCFQKRQHEENEMLLASSTECMHEHFLTRKIDNSFIPTSFSSLLSLWTSFKLSSNLNSKGALSYIYTMYVQI